MRYAVKPTRAPALMPTLTVIPDSPIQTLRSRLQTVLSEDDPRVRRLGRARTSVVFHVTGQDEPVCLLFDRDPPAMTDDAFAEVAIELSAADARAFALGELQLAVEVAAGHITFTGPVRKYLAVDPVLRALLREHAAR